ncbi:MAG: dCTP deaminase [Deltaproteobacteria bacterium]|nr:dCTP deaminase [Deltaproteobacteria bacterium]
MILKADQVEHELENPPDREDPLVITPKPKLEYGAASIDLRLGRWFSTSRQSRIPLIDVYAKSEEKPTEAKLSKFHYVPFDESFVLHPKAFVLGVTLEWIRLPADRAAYVIGRSSWGRHGLIIATATGVHPGFTGCLTLELSNVGEIPIRVQPGLTICQIFIHEMATGASKDVDRSSFIGKRKPERGTIEPDEIARRLARKTEEPGT